MIIHQFKNPNSNWKMTQLYDLKIQTINFRLRALDLPQQKAIPKNNINLIFINSKKMKPQFEKNKIRRIQHNIIFTGHKISSHKKMI